MTTNHVFLSLGRGLLIFLLMGSIPLASEGSPKISSGLFAQMTNTDSRLEMVGVSGLDSLKLSKALVEDWIHTRIETATLQNEMKANADRYKNVVQAFYKEREVLLQSRGWEVSKFEEVGKRITAALSAMDMAEELEAGLPDHQQQVRSIQSNSYYSESQKQEMIRALEKLREQKKRQFIQPTQKDWPSVKPYRRTIEQLTSWIAGNRANPPKV